MAAISPASQERLFVLGLTIASVVAIGLMRKRLIHYRDLAAIPPSETKPQYITQEVEDSLKPHTLNKLLDSPNYCIQETTSLIIFERALHDSTTIDVLFWYITRPDHKLREKGIRALSLMINSSTVKMINKPDTYAALVKSLEYCIEDYPHNDFDPEWDNWQLRDVVELGCLSVLCQLVDKFGPEGLVRSRFIERWLAKEPWGADEAERQINFAESLAKNNRLNEIVVPLFRDQAGRKQLCKVKLIPPALEDIRMTNGEGTAGEDFDGMFVESRPRRGQSSEQEALRRTHREAMVLNDGTRPLGRDDIFQRERQ